MKKIILFFMPIIYIFYTDFSYALSIKEILSSGTQNQDKVSNISGENIDGLTSLGQLLAWFKGEITGMVLIVAVAIFIFIGLRIVMARGNPEEFKKALLHFVYAILGIFFIFMAWGLVKLISTLRL